MARYQLTTILEINDDSEGFKEIERRVVDESRRVGRELLAKIMRDHEQKGFQNQKLIKKDRRKKVYETLLGRISMERWRSRGSRYPLDEWLGLKGRERVSPGLKQETIRQCATQPFAKAAAHIYQLTGIEKSPMSYWCLFQTEAMRRRSHRPLLPSWHKKMIPRLYPGASDPCPILGIDPDATYVRPRRKGDTRHEVKMAVMYTHRSPIGKAKGDLRWALGNKQVVVGDVSTEADVLFNRATHKAVTEYGLHSKSRSLCHGDGDPWIKRLKDYFISQTLDRLDPRHVFENIRRATDIETIPASWIRDFYKSPGSLIEKLQRFKRQLADDEDQERVTSLMGYLQNNRRGMEPSRVPRSIKQKYPRMYRRGSGTIESNIDWVIGCRCKRSRMNWSKRGLNNMLLIREDLLNKGLEFQPVPFDPKRYQIDEWDLMKQLARESGNDRDWMDPVPWPRGPRKRL